MNFYNIQIGTETKRGHFNGSHSFVCESENSQNEVYDHYRKKYDGFTVRCNKVEKIEKLVVEPILDTDYMGRNKYELEIDKLKKQIKDIKSSTKTSFIYRKLRKEQYPESAKQALIECEKFETKAEEQKEIATQHIKSFLKDRFKQLIDEVQTDKGFNNNKSNFSYRIVLLGEIAQELESEEQ